ncbi:hypothetical protein LBMAG21_06780 [Armatimonadota bacterium]|nr:hypothetical protein LBMAG21_06780 [Armatimonadota bacterium]
MRCFEALSLVTVLAAQKELMSGKACCQKGLLIVDLLHKY